MATPVFGARNEAPTTAKTIAAAHRAIDALADRASRSEQTLRGAAQDSARRYSDGQEQVRTQMNQSVERGRDYLRSHPVAAAGAAFAVGALFAAMLRGGRSQ